MIESVKVMRELASIPLAEAKEIVDESETWRDMREMNQAWRSRINKTFEAIEAFESDRTLYVDTVLGLAKDHPNADFAGPQQIASIEEAERRLGLRFPDSYRRFLTESGAGNLGSDDIYGVFDSHSDTSGIPDVVWATLDGRETLGLPDAAVLIGYDGGEGKIVLDLGRRQPDGSVPVVWWHPGTPLSDAPAMAADFSKYLFEIVIQQD